MPFSGTLVQIYMMIIFRSCSTLFGPLSSRRSIYYSAPPKEAFYILLFCCWAYTDLSGRSDRPRDAAIRNTDDCRLFRHPLDFCSWWLGPAIHSGGEAISGRFMVPIILLFLMAAPRFNEARAAWRISFLLSAISAFASAAGRNDLPRRNRPYLYNESRGV